MYLKNDKLIVTIKNTVFRSFNLTGIPNQFKLDATALSGWDDGVTTRRQSTQRPTTHGDFPDKATMAARVITITGVAVSDTRAGLQAMRDEFIGLLADGEYAQMSVETGAGIRYATVGVEATPSWIHQHDTIATFKLDMFAPDPHIYGPEKRFSLSANPTDGALVYQGSAAPFYLKYPLDYNTSLDMQAQFLWNAGNVESWPTAVVNGEFDTGFSLTDGLGHWITYSGAVTPFAPVVIDMRRGTASQNGSDRSTLLGTRGWWSIPSKRSVQPVFTPYKGANGWCDILYRDTWI